MTRPLNIILKDSNRANAALLRHLLLQREEEYRLFTFGSEKEVLDYLNMIARDEVSNLAPDGMIISPGIEDPKLSQLLKSLEERNFLDKPQIALTRDLQEQRQYPEDYLVLKIPFEEEALGEFLEAVKKQIEPIKKELVPKSSQNFESDKSEASKTESPLGKISNNLRVLIVDPNSATTELLTASLGSRLGGKCHMDSCRTLKEASRILQRHNYDAIVTDLNLPDSKGVETFQSIRATRPELATITVVEKGDEKLGEKTMEMGAQQYFIKEPDEYISKLTRSIYATIAGGNGSDPDDEFQIGEALESAPFMMVSVDKDLHIRNYNDSFINYARLPQEEVSDSCIFSVVPELKVLPLVAVFFDKRSYQDYGYKLSKIGQGHYLGKYWDLYAWPILDSDSPDGEVKEAVLIATDVSKRVEGELERKQLFAALAHDIRNPLLGIKNTLDMVLKGVLGDIQPPRLKSILTSFQKSNYGLLLMLSNIIDVYKHESSPDIYRFKPANITKIAEDVAKEVENLSGTDQAVVSIDFESGIPDLNLDESAMRRLFMNLLFNAVKFAEPGTEINFDIFTRESQLCMVVRNQGAQMGENKLSSVFRGVMESGSIKYGSGLGLYLCRKIAVAHKANIECRSDSDGQTRFILTMDLSETKFTPVNHPFYKHKLTH